MKRNWQTCYFGQSWHCRLRRGDNHFAMDDVKKANPDELVFRAQYELKMVEDNN